MERYLDYDDAGFIEGINRMKDGIDNVHDDTQEIIRIMTAQAQIGQTKLSEISKQLSEANHHHRAASRNQAKPASRVSAVRAIESPASAAPTVRANTARISNQQASSSTQQSQSRTTDPTVSRARISTPQDLTDQTANDQGGNSNTPTRRDSRGRFAAGDGGTEQERKLNAIARDMMNARINVDSGGYDPLVDSVRELGTVMSPLGQVGKTAYRTTKFSISKLKALKRREPLPQDQDRHNRENEKLLDKIWKAIRKIDSSGGGGGLLGGLLGGGRNRGGRGDRIEKLKNLAKAGLGAIGGAKTLGWLATAAGAAGLAMDWGDLDHKEKSAGVGGIVGGGGGAMAGAAAGALAGSVVPVIGTAVGGFVGMAVGGWLGSEGGEMLGAAASPYIDSWTSSLVGYNLPKKMTTVWAEGVAPFFDKLTEVASSIQSWFTGKWDEAEELFGFGGTSAAAPSETAGNVADFAIKNASSVSLGACAKYVNDAFRANGLQASGHGKDVAKNLAALNKGKFEEVGYDENYLPKIGDVMSMPSSKNSKHNYGHVAIYTSGGWVSDFKQGEKYGNTGAPNADYYDDIQSGRMKPKVVRMIEDTPAGYRNASQRGKASEAIDFFMAKGYTKAQAVGIAANLQQESEFDHQAIGDSGQAFGLAQWHEDRQANFKKVFGKSIKQSSFKEQLEFIHHEMSKGSEQRAGKLLKRATNEQQAAAIVSEYYERPQRTEAEKKHRAHIAKGIMDSGTASDSNAVKAKPTNSTLGFEVDNMTSSLAPASTGYRPAGLPVIRLPKIPPTPTVSQRLDSGSAQKPIILQTSNDTIGQNVSDRGLAHAITGGLGQDRHWS